MSKLICCFKTIQAAAFAAKKPRICIPTGTWYRNRSIFFNVTQHLACITISCSGFFAPSRLNCIPLEDHTFKPVWSRLLVIFTFNHVLAITRPELFSKLWSDSRFLVAMVDIRLVNSLRNSDPIVWLCQAHIVSPMPSDLSSENSSVVW